MNAPEMLDYPFGLLDPDVADRCEREMAADPALADRVDRLCAAVRRLIDDGEAFEVPPDLAARTRARVERSRASRGRGLADILPARVPFRWADVAVAAGILIAGVLTLIPAVNRSRAQANMAGCVANLQNLGVGLSQYAGMFGHYPRTPDDCTAPYAGSFAVLLNDANCLPGGSQLLDCPCNGRGEVPASLPSYEDLCHHEQASPRNSPCLKHIEYAYNLGHRRNGQAAPIPARVAGNMPLLADRPALDDSGRILEGNSRNHRGIGQNVLFAAGHVKHHPTRQIDPLDADIYLNANAKAAPGLVAEDSVLAHGYVRFDGR